MNRRLGGSLEDTVYTYSKLPVRMLLIAAFVLSPGFVILTRIGGQDTTFVYQWLYILLWALPTLLLLAAGALAIRHRIKAKRARNIATWAMAAVLTFLVTIVWTLCLTFGELLAKPVAYYTSPSGSNRLIIASYMNESYAAYPMASKYFYYPSDMEVEGQDAAYVGVITDTGVDRVLWHGEKVAVVYVLDKDNVERAMLVDFAAHSSELLPAGADAESEATARREAAEKQSEAEE